MPFFHFALVSVYFSKSIKTDPVRTDYPRSSVLHDEQRERERDNGRDNKISMCNLIFIHCFDDLNDCDEHLAQLSSLQQRTYEAGEE